MCNPQIPLFILLGTAAYLFPQEAGVLFLALVTLIYWQRH